MKQVGTAAAAGLAAMTAFAAVLMLSAGAAFAAPQQPRGSSGQSETSARTGENIVRGPIGLSATLEGRLSTDRTQYTTNRAVEIRAAIKNVGSHPQIIAPGLRYAMDITIRDSRTGHAFWTWSRHQPRPTPGMVTLQPGKEISLRALWDQSSDAGGRLPRGVYNVVASFYPSGKLTTQIFLSGNNGGGPGSVVAPPAPAAGATGSLTVSPRTVRRGGTVNLTYTVTNTSARPLTFPFRSGQMFDIEAFPSGQGRSGSPIWQWSRGRMFMQMLTQITLAPGQKRTFTEQWIVGSDVPDGAYDLTARLTTAPQGASAASGGPATATARVQVSGGGSAGSGSTGAAAATTGQAGTQEPTVPLGILLGSGTASPYAGRHVWVLGTYRRALGMVSGGRRRPPGQRHRPRAGRRPGG